MDSTGSISRASRCGGCKERIKDLHVLVCGHRFCQTCLKTAMNVEDKLDCPVCGRVTSLNQSLDGSSLIPQGPKPMDELQARITTQRRITLFVESSMSNGPSKLCDLCKPEHTHATSHCFDCKQNLCHACNSKHVESKFFAGHKTVPVSDTLFCKLHPQQVIAAVCHDCERSVCVKCVMELHDSHRVEDITQVAGRSRQRLNSFVESQESFAINGSLLFDIQSAINEAKDTKRSYSKFFGDFQDKLNTLMSKVDSVKSIVDNMYSETIGNLEEYKSSIDDLNINHAKLLNYAKYLLNNVPDAEIVAAGASFPASETLKSLVQPLTFEVPVVDSKFQSMVSGLQVMIGDCEVSHVSRSLGVNVDEILTKEVG